MEFRSNSTKSGVKRKILLKGVRRQKMEKSNCRLPILPVLVLFTAFTLCRYIFQIEINSGIHGQCFNTAKQNWQCYCESGIFESAPYQGIKSNTIINYINININLINYKYL